MRKIILFLLTCCFVPTIFGQSLNFNGNSNYVNFSNDGSLNLTTFTIEAWIKPEGAGVAITTSSDGVTAVPIIAKGRGEANSSTYYRMNYFLGINKDKKLTADFETITGVNYSVISTVAIKDSVWTHVAVSYEPTAAVYKLYINGVLNVTKDLGSNITPANTGIQSGTIASTVNTSSVAAGYFKGKVDEVRIWKSVRSDADILSNYKKELNTGTGLVARFGLNQGSGAIAINSVTTISNGTLINAPLWSNGFDQIYALNFNGNSNYITFGVANGSAGTQNLNLTSFTLEAWIKPGGTGLTTNSGSGGITAVPIISKGRGESDAPANLNVNYLFGIDKNKKLVADFEESNGANHPVTSTAVINDNVWTHVAVSYEPVSAKWKLYINGALNVTKDIGSNIKPVSTSIQHAAIGSAINSKGVAEGYFNGLIDEVRIWKVARTDADILNNYKKELASGTGLIARWSITEVYGTSIPNAIAGGTKGTFKGSGPVWTKGFLSPADISNNPPPVSGFSTVSLSSGWDQAVGLTFNKTGEKMFVWERGGKVWVVESGQKKLFIDISPEVGGYRDLGLLGFALHPQFETNGYFYLYYTVDRHHLLYYGTSQYSVTANEFNNATIGRLTRYTAQTTPGGYTVDTLTRNILIGATASTGIPELYEFHHVGGLVFGADGTLLLSAGDGASAASAPDTGSAPGTYYVQALKDGIITPEENIGAFRSQLLESYGGKILRIDPETGNGIQSNPFYDAAQPGSIRSKVWALGLRNPFRISIKPGTGSHDPADADPGILYLGDVGWQTFEEINVIDKPGMNFGWPIYEGLVAQAGYENKMVYNYYAPNPSYGVNGCDQPYFYFKDLIKQATASGTANFSNPCNTSLMIPSSVKTFIHSRPIIDWQRGATGPSRTGIFNGEDATVINIGAAGSPVSGAQFAGSCAIGGVFYPHNDFPAPYKNNYFFGDYASRWIRGISMDENEKPVAVNNPIEEGSIVVAMATHPTEYGLFYINFGSEIRKVSYNTTNHPPVAIAVADKNYGQSPVNVIFKGNTSYDPDGQPLTYLWNFGDGGTSTQVNPTHSFTAPSSAPAKYTVTLTVKDNQGSTNSNSLVIFVNNTPPVVTITSPKEGTLYPMTGETTYDLIATVTDKEHNSSQLSYQWQTILHHDKHEHPEPYDNSPQTTTVIAPLGCGDETYYYQITLTVTDAEGLSTFKEVNIYPDCSASVYRIKKKEEKSLPILKDEKNLMKNDRDDISVSYFPNPFKSEFLLTIQSKNENKVPVRVFDLQGRMLFQTEVQSGQKTFLGKQLAAGEYILEVGKGNMARHYTLLKLH